MFRRMLSRVVAEPPANFNLGQQKDRAADELIGLCRGVLADGAVCDQEAVFLMNWIERNAHLATEYPFNHVYRRLHTALTDGVIDPEEEADLLATLHSLVGGEAQVHAGRQKLTSMSSTLPLCDPPPTIEFAQRNFVVTGTFAYGPRSRVVAAIEERGGQLKASISKKVNYLVIGEIGSQAWRHSSYGRKIEAAVDLREEFGMLRIVSEAHWTVSLDSSQPTAIRAM